METISQTLLNTLVGQINDSLAIKEAKDRLRLSYNSNNKHYDIERITPSDKSIRYVDSVFILLYATSNEVHHYLTGFTHSLTF